MAMKRVLLSSLFLLAGLLLGAQSMGNYTPGKVAFTPVYEESFEGHTPEISRQIDQKLHQIVLQNGVGSYSGRYVISARVLVEDKQAVPTTPVQYRVRIAVSLLALDVDADVIIDELSLPLVGVDKTEDRAFLKAVQSLRPADPRVRTFVRQASDKAVAAYNESLDGILTEARSLMDRKEYGESLALLAQIPSDIDRYEDVRSLAQEACEKERAGKAAAAAAEKARREAQAEAAREAERRAQDQEIQLRMASALEAKAKSEGKSALVRKVASFFMGSVKLTSI